MEDKINQTKKDHGSLLQAIGTQKLVAIIALVVLFLFFWFFGENFAKYSTIISILDSSYYIGFMAIGVTFVIITGGLLSYNRNSVYQGWAAYAGVCGSGCSFGWIIRTG